MGKFIALPKPIESKFSKTCYFSIEYRYDLTMDKLIVDNVTQYSVHKGGLS